MSQNKYQVVLPQVRYVAKHATIQIIVVLFRNDKTYSFFLI